MTKEQACAEAQRVANEHEHGTAFALHHIDGHWVVQTVVSAVARYTESIEFTAQGRAGG